tara:strand:- start:465 stop:710 length:246 start_codon:yes stop_codon:yes gene_type:complete
MKKLLTSIIACIFCFSIASTAHAKNYRQMTAWPEAVTFTKQQMTQLETRDPSYENRLKGLMASKSSPFSKWEKRINNAAMR